jgi:4-amino-4-deoxy-L-arabinose transferase-like glycosyltransferase
MATQEEFSRLLRMALAAALAVTLVRIAVLILSPLQLYPDEAQYWWWAQSLSFGYVSKPPLIALIVWLTTTIFGNAEWAIRIGSPLLHGATSLLLFGIARRAFPGQPRTALWSSLAYLTLPGISYSSGLISTDVPLLFFWAVALYAFLRALDDTAWRWPILCGIAVGFGLLAKYAMFYFAIGAVAAALATPSGRRLVFSLRGLTILLIAAAVLSPNIIWNAVHGFPTVAHTEANADWSRARFGVSGLLEFVGGQFVVFGPLTMAGLLGAFRRAGRARQRSDGEFILVAFCVPPLILMLGQAFISEANANWAAAAYVAGTPLAVHELRRWSARWPLWSSFAVNGFVMVVLWIALVAPPFADMIGAGNVFKRLEGWKTFGSIATAEAARTHYDFVVSENRSLVAELLYYAGPLRPQIRIWDRNTLEANHFDMTMRLTRPAARVLLLVTPEGAPDVLPTFDSVTLKQTIALPVGGHRKRIILLYDAHDYRGPQNPA